MARAPLLLVAVVALLALAACGSSKKTASTPTGGNGLVGTVGSGFTISLTENGNDVSSLTAGSHKITINDNSTMHNFHLSGPGVDKSTGVGFDGTVNWTVTLAKGTYNYQCDVHPSTMHGSFTVG
jgi:plastocyanin